MNRRRILVFFLAKLTAAAAAAASTSLVLLVIGDSDLFYMFLPSYLTEHFATFEPSNPGIDELYVVSKPRSTEFESPTL